MRLLATLTTIVTLSLLPPQTLHSRAAPDFGPLEPLVGHCWIGTFPDGTHTDEHCFEWVYDRRFIRDRHVVRGGGALYQGETLLGWDAKTERVGYWYWNTNGQMLTGTVDYTSEGVVFPTTLETKNGRLEMKAVWSHIGPDGYRVWQGQRQGKEWKPLWTMDLRPSPGDSTPATTQPQHSPPCDSADVGHADRAHHR